MRNKFILKTFTLILFSLFGSVFAIQTYGLKAKQPTYFNISENRSNSKPIKTFKFFSNQLIIKTNSFSISIPEESGKTIHNSEAWEICFPARFKQRPLNFVRIHFRKDPKYLVLNKSKLDENGAYLSLYCHNSGSSKWVQWADQFGSEKFATVGTPQNLNRNVFNSIQNLVGNFPIDKIRLVNTGRGKTELAVAQIHYLECFFLPEVQKNKNYTRKFFASSQNQTTVRFVFDQLKGLPIQQKDCWKLQLPKSFIGRQINYIVLRFRQPPEDVAAKTEIDPDPAYILVQAQDKNTRLLWPWYDRYGTEKFVESRTADDPENESLHDCLSCMNGVQPDSIILTNVGFGNPEHSVALMHSAEVVFFAEEKDTFSKEIIFVKNTSFAQSQKGLLLPNFGGGPRFGGKYPGALMIGVRRYFRKIYQNMIPSKHYFHTSIPQPEQGYIDSIGRLILNLPAGKKFRQIEIAAGDVDNTVLSKNKDGHFGRLGWSELYCYLKSGKDQKLRLISNKANVGPEGIIVISPDSGDIKISENDQLVIESRLDVAFIMGIRFLFAN